MPTLLLLSRLARSPTFGPRSRLRGCCAVPPLKRGHSRSSSFLRKSFRVLRSQCKLQSSRRKRVGAEKAKQTHYAQSLNTTIKFNVPGHLENVSTEGRKISDGWPHLHKKLRKIACRWSHSGQRSSPRSEILSDNVSVKERNRAK